MWYLLLYLATLYVTRACSHVLGDPEHFSPYLSEALGAGGDVQAVQLIFNNSRLW